jgi:hypothetical protein
MIKLGEFEEFAKRVKSLEKSLQIVHLSHLGKASNGPLRN